MNKFIIVLSKLLMTCYLAPFKTRAYLIKSSHQTCISWADIKEQVSVNELLIVNLSLQNNARVNWKASSFGIWLPNNCLWKPLVYNQNFWQILKVRRGLIGLHYSIMCTLIECYRFVGIVCCSFK
jgi:hypothetical protein